MKYFIYVFLLLLFQFLLGYLESEYVYYFTAFQIVVFIVVALYLKFNINLNKYFVLFSYSTLLLLLSFLIDFSLVIYFFIFVTPITIFLSYRFHNEEKSIVKGIIFVLVILYSILSISIIHENIFSTKCRRHDRLPSQPRLVNGVEPLAGLDGLIWIGKCRRHGR